MGRWQKARIFLTRLDGALHETYDRLFATLAMAKNEAYGDKHDQMMSKLQAPCLTLGNEAGELFRLVSACAGDGVVDDAEANAIKDRRAKVVAATEKLAKTFHDQKKAMKMDTLEEELLDEHTFCCSVSAFGRIAVEFADHIIEYRDKDLPAPSAGTYFASIFDTSVLFDKGHLNFFLRNATTILLTFFIGYKGHSAMIQGYNSGPSGTVSLLLSTFAGSAMTHNLGRVQGAVLGTVLGQLAYVLFGWCIWWGYLMMTLTLFLWCVTTLFTYYHSPEFGYIAILLCAFGSMNMLVGCSDEQFIPTNSYYMIVNTIVGITVMTAVDMALAPGRASDFAYQKFSDSWNSLTKAIDHAFNPKKQKTRFHRGIILGKISSAESLGSEAGKEPRYWRTAWKGALYDRCIAGLYHIRVALSGMEYCLAKGGHDGENKSEDMQELMRMESFQNVRADIKTKLERVEKMAEIFVHETQEEFDFEELEQGMTQIHRIENLQAFLKEASTIVNKTKQNEKTLEDDVGCRICTIIVLINSIYEELRQIKHAVRSD